MLFSYYLDLSCLMLWFTTNRTSHCITVYHNHIFHIDMILSIHSLWHCDVSRHVLTMLSQIVLYYIVLDLYVIFYHIMLICYVILRHDIMLWYSIVLRTILYCTIFEDAILYSIIFLLYSRFTIFAIFSISGLQKPYYTRSWKIKRQRKYSNFPTPVDQAGVARLAVPRTAFGSCGAETGMALELACLFCIFNS